MSKKDGKEQVKIIGSNDKPIEKLQSYGLYDTTSYENVDGTVSGTISSALTADTLYRLKAYSADCWIKIGSAPTAVDTEGLLMTQYDELTLEVNSGDQIAVIGGKLNIVPLA